jgi:hypothetical protein
MTAILTGFWPGELPLLAGYCPTPSGWRSRTRVDPFLPVANGIYRVVRNAVRLRCRERLNQAALAGLARKARTPSMKASICGSVPMVTRHQFS